MRELITGLRGVTNIPGAVHFMQMERPAAVKALLTAALAAIRDGAHRGL